MHFDVVDSSFGTDHNNHRLIQTAHLLVPRDGLPARHTVVQVEINNAALQKNTWARVRLLNDRYDWTTLLDVPVGAWHRTVNPSTEGDRIGNAMGILANELFVRAVTILDH